MKSQKKKPKEHIKGLRRLEQAVINAAKELGFKGKTWDECEDWFNRLEEKKRRTREITNLLRGKVK